VSDRAIVIGRLRAVFRRSAVGTLAHGRAGSVHVALVLFGTFFVCAQAAAQVEDWPNRPVSMVVPYEPGGIVDLTARLLADHMAKVFPQPFIIENRAGAGGTIGTQYVARANPDGGTLLVASVAQIAIAPLIQSVKYDPLNDFVPISMFSSGVIALAVSTGITAKTTADLIAHAKANPGKLAYSSAGFGSFSHLGGAMFTSRAGIELLHVPYKGAFPAVQALLSDQVQVYVGNFAELHPLVEAGKLRLLAIATRERLAQTPDLPTIAETLPGFQMAGWQGLLAPARTPPPIVSRLEQQAIAAARSPSAIARLRNLSVTAVGSTAAEFVESIRKDIELYQRVTKAAGLEKQN
jgi:tripartite-type tricarboxylate transporter receptor subunit TctC